MSTPAVTQATLDPRIEDRQKQGRSGRREPLPLSLWVIVGFLLADGILRIVSLSRVGIEVGFGRELIRDHRNLQDVLTVVFSTLLILQFLLRTVAARIWGTAYFMLLITSFVVQHAFLRPELWTTLTEYGRVQEVTRLVFFTAAAVLVNSPPASRALR